MRRLALLVASIGVAASCSSAAPTDDTFEHTGRPTQSESAATVPDPSEVAPASDAIAEGRAEAATTERVANIRAAQTNGELERARTLLIEAVDALPGPAPADVGRHVALLLELDGLAYALGSLELSLRLREEVLQRRETLLPADHPDLLTARHNLAVIRFALGDVHGARKVFEEILETGARFLPPDHRNLLAAKEGLAATKHALGDLQRSRELAEEVLEARARLLPPDHPDLLTAKQGLAAVMSSMGDLHGAHELAEEVLEAQRRLLPSDHPDLLTAKQGLAATKHALGDLHGARALQEEVLAAQTQLLPPDHPDVLAAKQNLASTKYKLDDIRGAHELFEVVLEARTRLLPPYHSDLLAAKSNVALTKEALGDLHGARRLGEEVLEARERLLPPDHPDIVRTKQSLAGTRQAQGDLYGARELLEEILEARERLLPPDDPDVVEAKQSLAGTRYALGDLHGARELLEEVLEARERLLPPDHSDLLLAKGNLAGAMKALHDYHDAFALEEEVLEARARLLPPDHPLLLAAKQSMVATAAALGDLHRSRELAEEVLEARARLLPPDHPHILVAKGNLALTKKALGDLHGAHELLEEVLETWMRLVPPDHPDLLLARDNLAMTKDELGDVDGARELVASLLDGQRMRARSLRTESARDAREAAGAGLSHFSTALFVAEGSALGAELFSTIESLRGAAVARSEIGLALAERPELDDTRRSLAELRAKLNDHVTHVTQPPMDVAADLTAWRKELRNLAFQRDALERKLRVTLAQEGALGGEIDAASVARALGDDALAISYLRYLRRMPRDPATGERPPRVDSLVAFAVRASGDVHRVDLGPAKEIEQLVEQWRTAIGSPLAGRGVVVETSASDERSITELGERLRERILDPLLAGAGAPDVLHVVADDFLHLVPFDALPLGDSLLGEKIALRNEASFGRLVHPPARIGAEPRALLAGGVDYDREVDFDDDPRLDAATPPATERAGAPALGFAPLPETAVEVDAIAQMFLETFGCEPQRLTGSDATKTAVAQLVRGARYLHLATHGWFVPEVFGSRLDELAETDAIGLASIARSEDSVRGLAPDTLCGLALAGANRGRDAVGRVPGLLTAEELGTLDLRHCDLAVLSACETNVGIRRAGQGIQSLQAALIGAGARSAITSLWKVDDAATRRLFELFYSKLWKEKLGKHEALWKAKMALRDEGHPLRDWGAWVLTGEP